MDDSAPKDPNTDTTPNLTPQTPQAGVSLATPGISTPTLPTEPLQTTPVDTTPKKSSKLLIIVLCLLIAAVIIIGAIYFMMLQKGSKTSYNNAPSQTALTSPTPAPPTPTPTPDNSNTGLEQQNQAVTTDLNNLDTQVNQVNSSLSDQQTNLQ